MKLKALQGPFFLSFLGAYLLPNIFPSLSCLGFVPLLIIVLSRFSLAIALWISFFAGLFIDLYSMGPPLGFFALNYCLTSLIVYRYRKFFLEEKIFIFSLYSVLFSFVSTIIHFLLYSLIDIHLHLTLISACTDIMLMPLFDGVYTLVFVLFPIKAYAYATAPKRMQLYKAIYRKYKFLTLNKLSKLRAFTHERTPPL